ncbi:uncharacterized protein (DUF305 family) [Deinobacterium chartae]|uniref:Uncharacterized protein (DUF305 family) n=1 Tax=Deinobacterium chartae TaxID=521158 RepID=A0A841I0I6_9DEIO|nr:DUF305 domain-containing protein [Deinobacterium chartae]MBB6098484.1 uncharacterized protein (DUF305 family) [Deinobacterium chartae]
MTRTALAALLLTLTLSGAQAQMNHGNHGTPGQSAPASGSDLSRLEGKAFDRTFLSMMVAHHQGAVDMAQAALKRARDPQVRRWAQAVIQEQQREIAQMNAWLRALGGADRAAQASMGREMASMTADIRNDQNAERAFVLGMLPHHASALEMASLALQRSSDARVLELSRDIIRAQADEMYAYRQWLLKRR